MTPSDWIALAAVVITGGGAFLTFLTARHGINSQERTSHASLEAQRVLAHDERAWQRKAEVYEELLTHIIDNADALVNGVLPDDQVPNDMFGKVQTFADQDVYAAVLDYVGAMSAAIELVRTGGRPTEDFMYTAVGKVRRAVRADLGTGPDPVTLPGSPSLHATQPAAAQPTDPTRPSS